MADAIIEGREGKMGAAAEAEAAAKRSKEMQELMNKINDEVTGKLFYLEGDDLLLKDVKLNEKIHFISAKTKNNIEKYPNLEWESKKFRFLFVYL